MSFALFRLAGIGQGVYKRYLQGNASSTSAKNFEVLTKIVAQTAWKITGNAKTMKSNQASIQVNTI